MQNFWVAANITFDKTSKILIQIIHSNVFTPENLIQMFTVWDFRIQNLAT